MKNYIERDSDGSKKDQNRYRWIDYNKIFNHMQVHKSLATQNVKLFLAKVSEFRDTTIRMFNTL